MNSRKRKISPATPRPPKLVLPENVILCLSMSEFLGFADFRSLVRSVWRNNDESNIVREKLWQLSTHIAEIPFINGKKLSIEFNYDPWRKNQDCILINVESLLPIFGGVMPAEVDKFISVSKIENFVRMHVHLNRCSDYRHRSCPCHLKNYNPEKARAFAKPSVAECKFGHFHHYCSQHVGHWFMFFLNPLLKAEEENNSPDEDDIQKNITRRQGAAAKDGSTIITALNVKANCLSVGDGSLHNQLYVELEEQTAYPRGRSTS
ncbi:unnamed protein product [Pieris brassicae]|uniref:Uncharacterized protein n=1 Tax=Pieris brassicae TaxID=7116 RepID=A0A9P0T274_PIEBR|nr:unnamed protein product [Pieris brassicae]